MSEAPGEKDTDHGPVGTAISTSMVGNATAFGFSIPITGSFGILQAVVGSPTVLEIVLFGVAAAATVGVVEGVVSRGFRVRAGVAPPEVRLLGTAQNFVSVAAGLGAAAGVAALIGAGVAWPVGACAATLVFLAAESAEIVIAELVQSRRGDRDAESEETA